MRELELDFGIEHTGYRLSYFQSYNWGTFDNHIVTLKLDGKNSLLTGTNGSGKTTLVDAMLTLLVPSNNRTYNLSSGHEGKTGRTEESYVLGTYSTAKESEEYTASKKTLRDKSCHSIVLACFLNETAANSLTLMQIRYFSSNGSMRKQYFIIEGDFSIEMMNEKNVGYNTSSNWIQDLKKAFNNLEINNFDTFKRYSYEFSKKFGFRSQDKALRIFSQTVGMKDLSDLNQFIRTKMLDEENINSQFLQILKNYKNLMDLKNIIDKEEIQISLLQKIKETGIKYKHLENILFDKRQQRDRVLPIWEAQTAFDFLSEEINFFNEQKEKEEINAQLYLDDKLNLSSQIDEIKSTLNSDTRINRINELNKNRQYLKSIINQKEPNKNRYMKMVEYIGLPFPNDEIEYEKNKQQAKERIEIVDFEINRIEEEKAALVAERSIYSNKKDNLSKQVEAIKNKQSNIPINYLEIRDNICEDTGLSTEDLKFIGELIQVKENCLDKANAIETILYPFALTLLILPQHLNRVSSWLNNHKLKERIEIIAIENIIAPTIQNGDDKDQLSLLNENDDEIIFEEESLPIFLNLMVEVKENFEHSYFLTTLLNKHYKLELTDNNHVLFDRNGSFSIEGFAHCKQKLIKGATADDCDFRILGWNTQHKKERLNDNIKELDLIISNINTDIIHYTSKINKQNKIKTFYEELINLNDFEKITTKIEEIKINTIDSQLIELKEETSDLEILRDKLQSLQTKYFESDEKIRKCDKLIGAAENALDSKNKKKERYKEILNTDLTSFFEPISNLILDYSIPKNFANLDEINQIKNNIEAKINNEISLQAKDVSTHERLLSNYMNSFIHPSQEYLTKYPNWTYDTKDLTNDVQALSMYESLLDKLVNDSLPSYKDQFSKLQTRQMQKDIVDLNTSINRWDKLIRTNIKDLNESLNSLDYQQNPKTKIRITLETVKDQDIRSFKKLLNDAQPDKGIINEDKEETTKRFMIAVEKLILKLKSDDAYTKKVLDVRKWHNYAVEEYLTETNEQYRFYADSNGISGGQKAKLAYTILAAGIAHQFDVFNYDNQSRAFRFVIIDEAFSKSDDSNSKYVLNLFKAMDLQLMVVTPMDKVNLVEPFIESIQVTICEDNKHSFVHNIQKEEFLKTIK